MEIPRDKYPGTFMDKVNSISCRTDRDTGKLVQKYGWLLVKSLDIPQDKKGKFISKKLLPIYNALDNNPEIRDQIKDIFTQEYLRGEFD